MSPPSADVGVGRRKFTTADVESQISSPRVPSA
jgi:hypothetical protein